MRVVVDTSVLVAVIVGEPEREALAASSVGMDLVAPHSVHWEVGNALVALVRSGRLDASRIPDAVAAYAQIPLRFVDVHLDEALRLAHRVDLYAYDAYVLACARELRSPLLTLDRTLRRAAGRAGVGLVEV